MMSSLFLNRHITIFLLNIYTPLINCWRFPPFIMTTNININYINRSNRYNFMMMFLYTSIFHNLLHFISFFFCYCKHILNIVSIKIDKTIYIKNCCSLVVIRNEWIRSNHDEHCYYENDWKHKEDITTP